MAQRLWRERQPKQPKPLIEDLQRELQHGWLLPYLVSADDLLYGRWEYWAQCQLSPDQLPADTIPPIVFCGHRDTPALKMLERCLDGIPSHGSWRGWGSWDYVRYFFDWLLHGFGYGGQQELPEEPLGCTGASIRLYQLFDLEALLLWPYDYFGDMLAENSFGKHNGFYPTPHCIVEMMTQMICTGRDCRAETVCDPCCGTGRMLLHASNHSLRLYGQDIDLTVCKATLVNGYLYAPWLVKPVVWLDKCAVAVAESMHSADESRQAVAAEYAERISENLSEQAPPHYQERLFDTEFDATGFAQSAPILKRRVRHGHTSVHAAQEQMQLVEVGL